MNLDAFKPLVLTEVIGCPDPLLNQAILMAAAQFCRESMSWTETQDPITLVNGVSDYDLDAPMGAYLLTVRDVWVGNRRLQAITTQEVTPGERSSEPSFYNLATSRESLSVFPTPAGVTGASLVVRACYFPAPNATSLPDFLGRNYLDAITSGAKARLMAVPAVPWSNPALGAYYRQIFDAAIIDSRIDEVHDRVPGRITVQPRSFGF